MKTCAASADGGAAHSASRAAQGRVRGPWRPLNPYLVLLVAILLPGFGYALCGEARRGFIMQMFMVALAFVTWHLAPPAASLVGKLAGGLFVYALSLTETYRLARLRWIAYRAASAF
jgi:hypothetical protein